MGRRSIVDKSSAYGAKGPGLKARVLFFRLDKAPIGANIKKLLIQLKKLLPICAKDPSQNRVCFLALIPATPPVQICFKRPEKNVKEI